MRQSTRCMPGTCGGQKKASGHLELKLKMVGWESCYTAETPAMEWADCVWLVFWIICSLINGHTKEGCFCELLLYWAFPSTKRPAKVLATELEERETLKKLVYFLNLVQVLKMYFLSAIVS